MTRVYLQVLTGISFEMVDDYPCCFAEQNVLFNNRGYERSYSNEKH